MDSHYVMYEEYTPYAHHLAPTPILELLWVINMNKQEEITKTREENPDLSEQEIHDILVALEEKKVGKVEEFKFLSTP